MRHCNSNDTIILGGAFNCRRDKGVERGQDLWKFLESYNLECANDPEQPTYQAYNACSTINLVVYSTNLISTPTIRVRPTHTTKNHAILAEFELNSMCADSFRNTVRRVKSNVLEQHFTQFDVGKLDIDIDGYYNRFAEAFQEARISPKAQKLPIWFDKTLYQKNRELKLAYSNPNTYQKTYITLKKQFKHLCPAKGVEETRKRKIKNLYSRIWHEEVLKYSEIKIYSSTNVPNYPSRMGKSFR